MVAAVPLEVAVPLVAAEGAVVPLVAEEGAAVPLEAVVRLGEVVAEHLVPKVGLSRRKRQRGKVSR